MTFKTKTNDDMRLPRSTSYTELCIVQVMSGVGGIGGWARGLDRVNDSSISRTYEWRVKMETTTDITTATIHVKTIQKPVPTTIIYADKKGYSNQAPVRVRSFIFVSRYSSSESRLLIFMSYFFLFVTLSSECPPRSYPCLHFLTHLHFPPSRDISSGLVLFLYPVPYSFWFFKFSSSFMFMFPLI